MLLEYSEHPNYHFPYWLNYEVMAREDDFMHIMDVNEWASGQFGELGVKWGYTREHPVSSGQIISARDVKWQYFWRFQNREDAILFKLTWGGK